MVRYFKRDATINKTTTDVENGVLGWRIAIISSVDNKNTKTIMISITTMIIPVVMMCIIDLPLPLLLLLLLLVFIKYW
jgi:hypothetical protein